jgi:hypothetical protein
MLASAAETFAVVLAVAAAIGYLGMLLRRSARGGGCRGCVDRLRPPESCGTDDAPSTPPQQIVPRDNLADRARRLADEQEAPAPPENGATHE